MDAMTNYSLFSPPNRSMRPLRTFYHTLQGWQQYTALIPDDVFMAAIEDLAQAGLLDWLDGNPLDCVNSEPRDIDALREAVTRMGDESD